MPKLPQVSGREALAALERLGFQRMRTRGSHVIMQAADGRRAVVIVHGGRDLKPATLASILREAKVTVQEFVDAL